MDSPHPCPTVDQTVISLSNSADSSPQNSEKKDVDVEIKAASSNEDVSSRSRFIPDEDAEFVDPRLSDYPIPLVA